MHLPPLRKPKQFRGKHGKLKKACTFLQRSLVSQNLGSLVPSPLSCHVFLYCSNLPTHARNQAHCSVPPCLPCLGRGLLFGGSPAGSLGLTARCGGLSPCPRVFHAAPRTMAYIFGMFFTPSWLAFHVVVGFVASLAFYDVVWFGTSPQSGGLSSESLLAFVTRAGAVLLAVAPPSRFLFATFVSPKLRRGLKWWVCCVSSFPSAFVEAYCGASMLF